MSDVETVLTALESLDRAELQEVAGSTQVPLHDCMTGAVGCACSGMQRKPSCFV